MFKSNYMVIIGRVLREVEIRDFVTTSLQVGSIFKFKDANTQLDVCHFCSCLSNRLYDHGLGFLYDFNVFINLIVSHLRHFFKIVPIFLKCRLAFLHHTSKALMKILKLRKFVFQLTFVNLKLLNCCLLVVFETSCLDKNALTHL
jgi:hypothetical protein